ncbi:uncharacterized protein LOC134534031 [Bacillus rossius redtenbacheri]|uniref:uncharacterized protein LOC134534031 n=1 Tax=Bacillus rossius redtenbacheri TaxID=93214 RepID=UPI002FDED972
MPRTRKQARKTSVTDKDMRLAEYQKSYKHAIKTFEADVKTSMAVLESILKTSRKLISREVGNRLYEDVVKESIKLEETPTVDASITSTCDSELESTEVHSSTLRGSFDAPGSTFSSEVPDADALSDRTNKHISFATLPPPTANKNWKTPAVNHSDNSVSVVTPKVKPGTCATVLRVPVQGEKVLSMRGSPILVTTQIGQNVANLNVPLPDGRILSILPEPVLELYEDMEIDAVTRHNLLTLQGHINSFLTLTSKRK